MSDVTNGTSGEKKLSRFAIISLDSLHKNGSRWTVRQSICEVNTGLDSYDLFYQKS